jgi:hypothetical protein
VVSRGKQVGSNAEEWNPEASSSTRSAPEVKPGERLKPIAVESREERATEVTRKCRHQVGLQGLELANQATERSIRESLVVNLKPCHLTVTKKSAVAPNRKAP